MSVLDLFLELAALPTPPGAEREAADYVARYLRDLNVGVDEDDAAARLGSSTGNLLSRIPPSGDGGGIPIFLCAHLDTVQPESGIEPVVEDGIVRNAAGTILGADDKAAVAAMLDAVRRVLWERRPHAGIELLFTPKEEVGLLGAKAFDESKLAARVGFVYDQASPIGDVVVSAPSARDIDVRFHGRSAHAGIAPEEGRSAIAAAARAIADLRLGRIDDETSANVGAIAGGTARNVVPEWCMLTVEARSHDPQKLAELLREMLETFTFAATVSECDVETNVQESFRGYRFSPSDLPVRLAAQALERSGFRPRFVATGGGADANVFNERGLRCVNLGNGMAQVHTPDEHIAVADLEAMVEVTLALIDAAREASD